MQHALDFIPQTHLLFSIAIGEYNARKIALFKCADCAL